MTRIIDRVAIIRKGLKARCKTLSVRTGGMWVEIRGSQAGGFFTAEERKALEEVGLSYGMNFCVIGPDEPAYWMDRLSA